MNTPSIPDAQNELDILLCLSKAIGNARNRDDLWELITEQLIELFGARYYTIYLINEEATSYSPFLYSNEKSIRSVTGQNPVLHQEYPIGDGVFDKAITGEEPLVLDLQRLARQNAIPAYIIHWYNTGVKKAMLIRISNGKEPKGVLCLYSLKEDAFLNQRSGLLKGIADQLGTGISNILANETVESQLKEIKKYKRQLEQENHDQEGERIKERRPHDKAIGSSATMQEVQVLVSKVVASTATVLILGETGTGKELLARQIHNSSPRRHRLMIKVNCAAIPASLMESELFGHEKGSFTGAHERRIGKFELANNSTLFLDEIGELPLELQTKLLRVLQEREVERIGGKSVIRVNVRIIAATNKNLEAEVAAGRFRSDLYYRLNVFPITLPPLRERKEDIPALASFFISRYSADTGKKITGVSPKVMEQLRSYSWPGNIREMEHLIERSILLTNTSLITTINLPGKSRIQPSQTVSETEARSLEDVEREHILNMIRLSNGRISGPNGAAVKLRLPSTTLISKMQKLGIRKGHFIDRPEKTD